MTSKMHVYYSTFGVPSGSFTAAVVTIVTSWDGTIFAETNVKAACGPDKVVDPGVPAYTSQRYRVASVAGIRMNSPASFVS